MLKAGFCRLDVTPPLGLDMPGYYESRCSCGILEPLTLTAIAFDNGESKAIIMTADLIGMPIPLQDKLKAAVAARCGLEENAVFFACTHIHTAAHMDDSDCTDPDYEKYYYRKAADCAQLAFADAKPAKMSVGFGIARDIAFIRRFRMKDGTTKTNPGFSNPDIDHPIGEADENMQLLSFKQEGGDEILVVNFQVHPDVIGGEKYSADYPGFARTYIEAEHPGTRCAYFNGCQGDTNHIDPRKPKGSIPKGSDIARHMARVIADAVSETLKSMRPLADDTIRFSQVEFDVALNSDEPEMIEKARAWVNDFKTMGKPAFLQKYGENAYYNQVVGHRLVYLANLGYVGKNATRKLRILSIRIGGAVFTAMPGEPFTEVGRQIKAASSFDMCVVCCCANGYEGYFPTEDAASDGYEGLTCRYKPGIAEQLIDEAIKLNKTL